MTNGQTSKCELLKKAAYVAPMMLTLKVAPTFAASGSGLAEKDKEKGNNGVGNGLGSPAAWKPTRQRWPRD